MARVDRRVIDDVSIGISIGVDMIMRFDSIHRFDRIDDVALVGGRLVRHDACGSDSLDHVPGVGRLLSGGGLMRCKGHCTVR